MSYLRLDVLLSWWLSLFVTMKGVELICLSSDTLWEGFRATDDAGISLVYNPYTALANTLMYHEERFCIIVGGIEGPK